MIHLSSTIGSNTSHLMLMALHKVKGISYYMINSVSAYKRRIIRNASEILSNFKKKGENSGFFEN